LKRSLVIRIFALLSFALFPFFSWAELEYDFGYEARPDGLRITCRLGDYQKRIVLEKGIVDYPIVIRNHFKSGEEGCLEFQGKNFILAVPFNAELSCNLVDLQGEFLKVEEETNTSLFSTCEMDETRRAREIKYWFSERGSSYPEEPYEIRELGVFRGLRLVRLKLYPYTLSPDSNFVWLNTKIDLELSFNSRIIKWGEFNHDLYQDKYFENLKSSLIVNYREALAWGFGEKRAFVDPDSWDPRGMIKLVLRNKGFYHVTGKDLENAGVALADIEPSKVGIYHLGKQVASRISIEDGAFADDDFIEFFGESIESKYTDENVYWISLNENNPRRIGTKDASVNGSAEAIETHFPSIRFEENKGYKQVIPDGDKIDHWYWIRKIIGETKTDLNITLNNLADLDYTARITVRMLGETDIPAARGHLVRVLVNGEKVGETTWFGITEHDLVGEIEQSKLNNGDNLLEIYLNPGKSDPDNPLDPVNADGINLNWIEFKVEKFLVAEDGVLFFSWDEPGDKTFKLTGFPNDQIYLYDVSDPANPVELTGFQVYEDGGEYVCEFGYRIYEETEFIAFSSNGYSELQSATMNNDEDLKAEGLGADYIIITDPSFSSSLSSLVRRYESQGMRVLVVTTEQIYNQFEFGIFSPEGIRNFLRYAYYYYADPPPSFVLLAGDANFDYKNYLKTGGKNHVPPYIFNTEDVGETPTDLLFASVSGDDDLPDMAVGRIPVNSVEKLESILQKIENYSISEDSDGWNRNVIFASGRSKDFEDASDELRESIPDEYNIIPIYLKDYENSGAAKEDLIQKINAGVLMLNYVGHSNVNRWENSFLVKSDVPSFENYDKLTFWVMFNCLNGYFTDPRFDCLAEVLIRSENGGAVACLAQSNVGYPTLQVGYGEVLYSFLFESKMKRIGEMVLATGITLGKYDKNYTEMINSTIFFGDPALSIRNDFGENSGLYLDVITDKSFYYSDETVEVDIKCYNIGPDVEDASLYALVLWNDDIYFLPEGDFEPIDDEIFIPSGATFSLKQINFDPFSYPPETDLYIYSVVVKKGTLNVISNVASTLITVNKSLM